MAREYAALDVKTKFRIPKSMQLSQIQASNFFQESKKDEISGTNECKTEIKDLREITIGELNTG